MDSISRLNSNSTTKKMGHRRKGSDPLLSTVRGKLQSRRSKVNDQINREVRMRDGAENLYKATGNKRLKELVTVELSFFNSNIQLLKEELSVMNSTVDLYQCEENLNCTPVIPIGLKETSDTDMTLPLKDFILEHYSEDGSYYEKELYELRDLRQAIRTPQRNEAGISLLMEYFNHLYFVEKRFFPPDRKIGVHFHWYDSLTGVPTTQKSIGFEKGSILFNSASLYTQMACKQNRSKQEGIRLAILNFQRAAGALRYLLDHFSHAPSKDMQPETLTMMIQLMLSQAQECLYELKVFGDMKSGVLNHVRAAQEAVVVSQVYDETQNLMSMPPVKEYIPSSWMFMSQVKCHYYMGLAHYYVALAAMDQQDSGDPEKLRLLIDILEGPDERRQSLPQNFAERKLLGKAHLRESLVCHEEALWLHDFCKQLRKIDSFLGILKSAHERSLAMYSSLEEEDDFSDIFRAPQIRGATELQVAPVSPEFSKYKVSDIFHKLGPILIFNAKSEWTVPRTVILDKNSVQGFGFSVRGDSSVIIADIEANSVAEESSMEIGDLVAAIGDKDTKWAKHDTVVNFVRQSGNHLELRLITPLSSNLLEVDQSTSAPSSPRTPLRMQSPRGSDSSLSTKNTKSRFSAPWIFTKKGSKETKEKLEKTRDFENGDIMLR